MCVYMTSWGAAHTKGFMLEVIYMYMGAGIVLGKAAPLPKKRE